VTSARPGFERLAGVEVLPLEALDVPNLGWLLCKLSPADVCCLLKPFVVRRLMSEGFDTILYADSDMHFFADGAALLSEVGDNDFLVTPHLMSPLPFAEPWTKSTMGDLADAGVLNAGLIVFRNTPGAKAFVDTWSRLCVAPGAFLTELGGTHEQQFFNWVYAFSDRVRVCRDPRMNVAYWNLHERPIRWGGLDGRDPRTWYLDGLPIVCFHFSGFAWNRGRLSVFDDRSRPEVNANLFALCEYYAHELEQSGKGHYAPVPYEFDSVHGLDLDPYIRTELKRAESRGTPQLDAWSSAGPAALRLLTETLGDLSLVPKFLEPVQLRTDLAPFHDHVFSREWLRWADLALWRDHDIPGRVYEQFCPFVFHRDFVDDLVRQVHRACPSIDEPEIARLLKRDRTTLLRRLAAHTIPAGVLHAIEAASYRIPAFVPAIAVRLLYAESAHLQEQFPDVTGADARRFREWLINADDVFELPESVRRFARDLDFERSVARVLGKTMRIPHLVSEITRAGYRRDCLFPLVGGAQGGCGYGPDDLVLADWWLQAGGDAARTRVNEILPSDSDEDGFADYLEAWCRRRTLVGPSTPAEVVGRAVEFLGHRLDANGIAETSRHRRPADVIEERIAAALAPRPMGVNVFGYFKSPIGLGTASRGLCRALDAAGYEHRALVIPNDALDADITLDDLFQDFAFNYPRNLVVSYPHIEYQLQSVRPRAFFGGRETVGYFAWEQRDFPATWTNRLAPYDRLCALSRFSAEAISRGVNRTVDVLPCVVETGAAVAKEAARKRFGIAPGKFVIGYVFDAASSIERKNPWALIEAVARAFERSRDVVLVMKVGSGRRPDFAPQVLELARRAATACGDSVIITDYLSARDVETLLCALDVYVSLHRSEGFGYTLAEAMLLGVPAMATNYSGNLDFMTEENSHLVSCREVPVRTREGPFETGTVWAEPDLDHAVALLRQIHADYPAALARAQRSIADLASVVSPAAVARAAAAVMDGRPTATLAGRDVQATAVGHDGSR
jgi:glycosyltransferase involved in cell wall biosynthesis